MAFSPCFIRASALFLAFALAFSPPCARGDDANLGANDFDANDGNGIRLELTAGDVVGALRQIAQTNNLNLVFLGPNVAGAATVSLRGASVERAFELLTQAAGLSYRKNGDAFLVGAPQDVANLPAAANATTQIYRCKHVNSASLVATLSAAFDPNRLKAVVGPTFNSPTLETAASSDGTQAFNPLLSQQGDDQLRTFDVILSGEAALVQQALQLCEQIDRRRAQVRLKVNISNVSLDASRDLGLEYDFSTPVAFRETQRVDANGEPILSEALNVARLGRTPLSFSATLQALERSERAKILAQPTLSLLDGERSFILIGQRQIFPVLTGYSQNNDPIYSTQEVRVGVYIQVAAQIGADEQIVLSIYPQVSSITGFLEVGGTRYPQISTREQQTTVRARNGETFVLGGLIRDEEVKSLQRVPLLSQVPILGELFKSRGKSKFRSELLVAITPELIRDENAVSLPTPTASLAPTAPTAPPAR